MLNHQGRRGFKSPVGKAGGLAISVMPIGWHRGISRWLSPSARLSREAGELLHPSFPYHAWMAFYSTWQQEIKG